MTKISVLALLGVVACFVLCSTGTAAADDNPISATDRQCGQNEDCTLIVLHCACDSMSCYSHEDIDALNKQRFEQFKYLEHCTDAQLKSCAQGGVCPAVVLPFAVCQDQQCVVSWQPNPVLK